MGERAKEGDVDADSPILRGSRMFIELRSIGEVNDKGRAVLSIGFKGKIIADPDKAIQDLVLPLLGEVTSMARWSSHDAMAADVDMLAKAVGIMRANVEGMGRENAEATGSEAAR